MRSDPPKGAIALLLAAGGGERIGRGPKAYLEIAGTTILELAAGAIGRAEVARVVAVVPPGTEQRAAALLARDPCVVAVVGGGADRQDSVRIGLERVDAAAEIVVCHDAARPFAAPELFSSVIAALRDADGAVPGVEPADTVKRVRGDVVEATLPREDLRLSQTPQAFRAPALRDAHIRAAAAGVRSTDDAALLEWAGYRVRVVRGDARNFKITSPDDLDRAERAVLEAMNGTTRG